MLNHSKAHRNQTSLHIVALLHDRLFSQISMVTSQKPKPASSVSQSKRFKVKLVTTIGGQVNAKR